MSRYKAIIFDLDGTLCYTMDDLAASMNEMLGILGYPKNSHEHLLSIINNGAKNFVRKALPPEVADDPIVFDTAYAVYDAVYALHCNDKTVLYDGIADMLSELRSAGIKVGVLTNKQDSQSKQILHKLLPEGTFDEIVGAGRFPVKPDPTAPLWIADYLGVSPDDTVFCGDSDVDMKTAHAAGMFPLGVTWGYRSREVLIEAGVGFIADKPADIASFLLG